MSGDISERSGSESKRAAEQATLDKAIAKADQLLVSSLKNEDRRRRGRRSATLYLGGIAMLTVVGGIALVVAFALPKENPQADQAAALSAEGWKLWQSQEFKDAIAKFDEAVKLDPKNSAAWNGLGWASFNSGEPNKAQAAFEKVIALEPKHPAALNGLGQIALMQRKYPAAEKYLLKAAPSAPAAWYGLARVYLLTGKYDQAAKWAKKIVDSGEADEGAEAMLAAAKAKKLPDELRAQIEPPIAAERAGDVARGWRLMNQGRRDEAKEVFAEILKKSPADASALNGMGWLLLNGGEHEEAKPYFERAIAADPKASGAMNGLARSLYAADDVDGAIEVWKKMVAEVPGTHAGTFGLADAYAERGEFKLALPLYEQLAKAHPEDQQIRKKLERARRGGTP